MSVYNPISISEILKERLYLGNLAAVNSLATLSKYKTTHVLSVCTEEVPSFEQSNLVHLKIAVDDTELEDLLAHLPTTYAFIRDAIQGDGCVFVHCAMGVSRSATVVCAYMMQTRQMSVSAALKFVKKLRPQIHPNYGFIKQLHVFSDCHYDPSPLHPCYISWSQRQARLISGLLMDQEDLTAVIPGRLYMSHDFPTDPEVADALLIKYGITHLVTISPSQFKFSLPNTSFASADSPSPPASMTIPSSILDGLICLPRIEHFRVEPSIEFSTEPIDSPLSSSSPRKKDLVILLPKITAFTKEAIARNGGFMLGGVVLVHCMVQARLALVICACLMEHLNGNADEALFHFQDVNPLFNPTAAFSRRLELFEACAMQPTEDHLLVKAWMNEMREREKELSASRGGDGVSGRAEMGKVFDAIRERGGEELRDS